MRTSHRNNPATDTGPVYNRGSDTRPRSRGDVPTTSLAIRCTATTGRSSHQKETRASRHVGSRDERAGYLQIGSAFASSPLTVSSSLEELHANSIRSFRERNLSASFFTVSYTLSFTLYMYHASKEQKCFFEYERQSIRTSPLYPAHEGVWAREEGDRV